MFDFWQEELTTEERDRLVDRAAAEIRKRKMELPAILMLELHKPLSYVGSQAAIVFSPFLVPFLGFDFTNDFSRLFSDKDNVERLLNRLENKDSAPTNGASEDSCSTTTPVG